MSEKNVSVRFAAQGGDKVKAELRGIGMAGKDAMQDLARSSGPAEAGLDQISATARRAQESLESLGQRAALGAASMRNPLQKQIASITGAFDSGQRADKTLFADHLRELDNLRAAYNPLYAEIRKYTSAVNDLRAAEAAGAISTEEAAAAKARLRTASLSAIDGIKGISAANKEAARAAEEAAAAEARQARQLDDLRARYNPVYAATRQYKASLADLNNLKAAGVITSTEYSQALEREADRMRLAVQAQSAYAQATQQASRASRGATLRMQQLGFQINDIGVSLAGGMNPLLVMAQQGTQIAQIYGAGNGGVGGALRDLGFMARTVAQRFWPIALAVGAATAAVAEMTSSINETSDVTVTMGDTAKAVFQVIGRYIYDFIEPAVGKISEWFDTAWDAVVSGVKWTGNALINGTQIAVDGIATAVGTIPDIFLAAFNSAVSHVLTKMHDMVWYVAQAVNGIAGQMNEVFGTDFSTNAMGGIVDTLSEASGSYARTAGDARGRIAGAWRDFARDAESQWNEDPMGDFYNAVRDQAIQNARDREAEEKKKSRGGRSEKDEVADLIAELKNQLAVLRETDPIKKQMLEYSERLADATAAERAEVEGLVISLDNARHGWEAVSRSLAEYAEEAKRIGDDIGDALVGAFNSAEQAIGEFVKTGKMSFSDLVTSLIADLAQLAARKFLLGPLAAGLDTALGGIGGGAGFFQNFAKGFNSYDGGGWTGDAPRVGGLDGKGGFLAMMHPRERVYDEAKGQGAPATIAAPVININGVRDVESFRRSRAQIAADLGRGLSMGRRTT